MVAASPPLAEAGVLLAGRFLIEGHAGRGGMGAILRALDQQTGRPVAIKLLHSGTEDPNYIERFLREARLLARLSHPAIVSHVAHGELAPGVPYLAMEWVEGEDLAHRLQQRGLTTAQTLGAALRAGEALRLIHSQGIVHRDVKPSNMILRDGDPEQLVLLDFGIARSDQATRVLTQLGAVIGTPEYMSPEQARGELGLTPAADVFSLGCVLYECLAGRSPFAGEQIAAVLAKILFDEPVPLKELRPEVPAQLTDLIAAMLEKNPQRRPLDGAQVLAALQALPAIGEGGEQVRTGSSSAPPLTAREQQYISVVLARPQHGRRLGVADYASILHDASTSSADHAAFAGTLAMAADMGGRTLEGPRVQTGARIETLVDGSLVAVVAAVGPATDQAMQAARLALLFKEHIADVAVVVATGRGVLSERLPIGDAIDRAVQLCPLPGELASEPLPAGVLLDLTTAQLIESRFLVEYAPALPPRLLREQYDADTSRPLLGKPTPCIGREAELSMLDGLYQACRDEGTPAAVLLVAPPGMGKSRLRHEFIRRITAQGTGPLVLVLLGRGEAMSAGSSYGLLSQAIRRMMGAQDGEPTEQQQEKLRRRLARHLPAADVDRVTVFIAEMCSIPFGDHENILLRAARQDPSAMSEQVSRAFMDLLRAECKERPVVLVLEDLHWGDALTVRLCHEALRSLSDAPLLVLATARPEIYDIFPRLWAERLQVISLSRLGKKACERLIKQVLGTDTQSAAIAQIIERAGGNALYLEELIRAAAEGNSVGLPETVLAMVQARLLRVSAEARRILRAASVFGETFWRGGIIQLCGGSRRTQQIDSLLETLIESETIEARSASRFPGEQEYAFRHALVRDAAYSMIPPEEQPGIHRRAGEYLERCGERDPMILAEHFLRGGQEHSAVLHLVHATEQAYYNNDTDAVLLRARRGLEAGATGETRGILLVNQGRARGWKEDDWSGAYAFCMEALDLLPPGSVWWYRGMYSVLFVTSMAGMRNEFAALIGRFTAAQPLPDGRGAYVEAAASLVVSLSMLGMRAQARQLLDDMLKNAGDLIQTDPTTQGFMRYAQAVSSRFCEADPWAMLQSAEQCCAAFDAAANRHAMILGGGILAAAYLDLGELEKAESVARANFARAQKLGDHFVIAQAAILLAQVLATRGPAALEEGIRICEAVLSKSNQPIFAGRVGATLTQLLAECGQIERAVEVGQKASQQLALIAAEYYRSVIAHSSALLLHGEPQAARELCEQALRRFEQQHSSGFSEVGLFLATARARLACGQKEEARAALREGLKRVQARAERIPDAAARARYLDHPSDNGPLRALAAQWQVTAGS